MARSKYTFENREREKAKRQKQIQKSAQRMMAKKAKAGEAGTTGDDAATAEDAPGLQPPAENGDSTDRG